MTRIEMNHKKEPTKKNLVALSNTEKKPYPKSSKVLMRKNVRICSKSERFFMHANSESQP